MKRFCFPVKMVALLLAGSVVLASCSSTTTIQSSPTGAKLYLNGEPVGKTPYTHTDTKIVGSSTSVKLEKEGYEPLTASFSRNEEVDVGAIIGGMFVFFPFLWTMKYKPTHTYELTPLVGTQQEPAVITPKTNSPLISKAVQLRELKGLLDDNVITHAEYEAEKKKILEED